MGQTPHWSVRPLMASMAALAIGMGAMVFVGGWSGVESGDAACRATNGCGRAWIGAIVPGALLIVAGVVWAIRTRRWLSALRWADATDATDAPDDAALPADRLFERAWHGTPRAGGRVRRALWVLGVIVGAAGGLAYVEAVLG